MSDQIHVPDFSFRELVEDGKLDIFIIDQLLADLECEGPHAGEFGKLFSDEEEEKIFQTVDQNIYVKPRYYITAWPVEVLTQSNHRPNECNDALKVVKEALLRRLADGFIKMKVPWSPPGEKGTTLLDNYRHTLKGADLLLVMRDGKHIVQHVISRLVDDANPIQNEDGGWPQWSELARESDLWSTCYAIRFLHRYLQSGWLHDLRGDVQGIQQKLENRLESSLTYLEGYWSARKWQYGSKSPWMTSAPLAYLEISECLKLRSSNLLLKPSIEFKQLLNASGYVRPMETGLSTTQDLADYRLGVWLCYCLSEVADTDEDTKVARDLLWNHLLERGHTGMDLRTYEWSFLLLLYWRVSQNIDNSAIKRTKAKTPMHDSEGQSRFTRLWKAYNSTLPKLFEAKDLNSLAEWLLDLLEPIYPRLRLYWYDQDTDSYYGLRSRGMHTHFVSAFDVQNQEPEISRKYEISFGIVPYEEFPHPRVLILNKENLEREFVDQEWPRYFKDIFLDAQGETAVEQTATVEIPDAQQPEKPNKTIGAISIDLGQKGQPFSSQKEPQDLLLLATIMGSEWGLRFNAALRRQVALRKSDEGSAVVQIDDSEWEDLSFESEFYSRHKMGYAYETVKGPMVYNATVPKDEHPLFSSSLYRIDYFREEGAESMDDDILLISESGCGKELLARAIHQNGPKADKPFIPVDMRNVPEARYEVEMEGSDAPEGPFAPQAPGHFRTAKDGILFLDNIHRIDIPTQEKMLRNIRDREIKVYGGKIISRECVIIMACNGDIHNLYQEGRFFEDFYGRLLEFEPIELPPLIGRRCDIVVALGYHAQVEATIKKPVIERVSISGSALKLLFWSRLPGNFAKIKNVFKRKISLARSQRKKAVTIDIDDLKELPPVQFESQGASHPKPNSDLKPEYTFISREEENQWRYWTEGLDNARARVQLYPWPQSEPVEIYPPQTSTDLDHSLYDALSHNPRQTSKTFPVATSREEADQLFRKLRMLAQVAKHQGYKDWWSLQNKRPHTGKQQILTSTIEERLDNWAEKLGKTKDDLHHELDNIFKGTTP